MGFFRKVSQHTGRLAIGILDDGICAAYVARTDGAAGGGIAGVLPQPMPPSANRTEEIGRDLHAGDYTCATLLNAGEDPSPTVETPNVPQEELKTAIRWRLKDLLDFHIDDATIDIMDIPATITRRAQSLDVCGGCAQPDHRAAAALFTEAKMPLSVIDIPEMAQRNIAQLVEPEGRGIAFLTFGAEGGLLTLTYGGELYLSRQIDVRLQQLENYDESQRAEWHDRVTLELQRSLDHFDRQFHFITLAKMVLGPMGQGGRGLQAISGGQPAFAGGSALELESVLDISRTPELRQPESQQRYLLTLGAALRLEEKVL